MPASERLHQLEGDLAAVAGVDGAVDDAHAALAELVADPEPLVPQLGAGAGAGRIVAVVGGRIRRGIAEPRPAVVEAVASRAWSVVGSARRLGIGPTSARMSRRQYESDERTSPPRIVFRPIQMTGEIVSLMNRTEPSPNPALTPPGCRLREPE